MDERGAVILGTTAEPNWTDIYRQAVEGAVDFAAYASLVDNTRAREMWEQPTEPLDWAEIEKLMKAVEDAPYTVSWDYDYPHRLVAAELVELIREAETRNQFKTCDPAVPDG